MLILNTYIFDRLVLKSSFWSLTYLRIRFNIYECMQVDICTASYTHIQILKNKNNNTLQHIIHDSSFKSKYFLNLERKSVVFRALVKETYFCRVCVCLLGWWRERKCSYSAGKEFTLYRDGLGSTCLSWVATRDKTWEYSIYI